MTTYKAGIIGCGGRGRAHAEGYLLSSKVEIVACADPIESTRESFARTFGISNHYEDYRAMLDGEQLDFVSVCTWTGQHREMIEAAASSGHIKAIHSEKPMAPSWGDAKALYRACVDNGVVITFCHQRRFGAQFIRAKQLLDEGAIGQLQRVEGACSNLFDWGTHWFDMFFFYNNDTPAEWVMGQIAVEEDSQGFGIALETSGLSWIRWHNGVEGLLATGNAMIQGPRNRLRGSDGTIEIGGRERPPLRILRKGADDWENFSDEDLESVVPEGGDTALSVLDLIEAIEEGREPMLSGRKALQATELIFATYESSRRRGRVLLPLQVDDSALLTMLETGQIDPGRK